MIPRIFLTPLLAMNLLFALHVRAAENDPAVVPSVIIGGGVGGGTAAIYLARAGFRPIVIQGSNPGGAIVQSEMVENWPGAMQIKGADLMERIRKQAEMNGALFRDEEVVSVDFSKRPFTITTRSLNQPSELKTIRAASCIIATGATPNFLHVPGESEFWGRGVSNCAICDGSLYKGKRVGIVGGGDSAVLEAMYLANMAKEVTLFVRKDHLKAVDETRKAALAALANVKVFYQTAVEEILGDSKGLTGVKVREKDATHELALDGLFLAIGSRPNTSLFKGKLELDENGYLVLKSGQRTSVPWVYATGDAADPLYKQAISAAGDGAKAALAVQAELSAAAPSLLAARSELQNRQAITAAGDGTKDTTAVQAELSGAAPQKPTEAPLQVIEIKSLAQFEEELKNSNMPLVVDFYASWCSPCRRIAPKLETTAIMLAGKVKFLKVNVDTLGDLTTHYNIRAMPTVLFFNPDGTIVDRKVGEKEIGELMAKLTKD